MNQTRTFLIFAWLMVAMLLWMEWSREQITPAPTDSAIAPPVAANQSTNVATVPANNSALAVPSANIPQATVAPDATVTPPLTLSASPVPRITVTTDVLKLVLDGDNVLAADLLHFPQTRARGSDPVQLLTEDPAHPYRAHSAWSSPSGSLVPGIGGFQPEHNRSEYNLAEGQNELKVVFVWNGADGTHIRRTYTFGRGSYAIEVHDEIRAGNAPWQGHIARSLERVPPVITRGMTNPDSFSFNGATWYGPNVGYQRRDFSDYLDDGNLNQTIEGGWLAMIQHHFFTAWIPQPDQPALYLLAQNGPQNSIEARGPGFSLAPGQQAQTQARLWVGPKLVGQIAAQQVKGLDRVVDYSRFSLMAVIGQGLFWVLNAVHKLVGNWGWAIIGLVILLKLALFPLSAAQFKSQAKMRRFQPRIAQLKERYGDDRQKFQMAMMELYKKEKINPMGGCLPLLIQMPVFFALYWVLVESVELRQAPWMGWIVDLTARDPYFILPVLNAAVMWFTQKLTPAPGMDPMQQKMMQFMPLIFGAMMVFFPSGLVLYWVVNGSLSLLQQWWMIRKYDDTPVAKA